MRVAEMEPVMRDLTGDLLDAVDGAARFDVVDAVRQLAFGKVVTSAWAPR
jgi:hypothetical protein